MSIAINSLQAGKAVACMKIDSLFIALLLLGGTTLYARILTQGVESALVATALDWFIRRINFFARGKKMRR